MDEGCEVEEQSVYPDVDQQLKFPWLGESRNAASELAASDGFEGTGTAIVYDDEQYLEEYQGVRRSKRKKRKVDSPAVASSIQRSILQNDQSQEDDQSFFTLQTNVEEFQENLRQKQHYLSQDSSDASESDHDRPSQPRRGGRGGPRGPRKPAEPSLEIKLLLSQANSAFLVGDYDKVEDLTNRVIQMNAEVYAAHALLSAVFRERGEFQMAVVALISAAHLRPKDSEIWRNCADLILEQADEDRKRFLNDAIYCYTRIIGINPKDFETRYERASLLRELGHQGRAARELEHILSMLPGERTVLRQLAELCIDLGDVQRALKRYDDHIRRLNSETDQFPFHFDWSDVNVYSELYSYAKKYPEGIREIKMLSRWLLGRREELFWDDVQEDDREFDSDNNPRRSAVPEFHPAKHSQDSYGDGLPLELRVKLGVYRLRLGPEHFKEAMRHFSWLTNVYADDTGLVRQYSDLFREVAVALKDSEHKHEALEFFEPLQQVEDQLDSDFYFGLAECYRADGLSIQAELCYRTIVENDETNVDARMHLVKMFQDLGQHEKAAPLIEETIRLGNKRPETSEVIESSSAQPNSFLPTRRTTTNRPSNVTSKSSSGKSSKRDRTAAEKDQNDAVLFRFESLQRLQEDIQQGFDDVQENWMTLAASLVEDFRQTKSVSASTWKQSDLEARQSIEETESKHEGALLTNDHLEYRQIPLDKWLDLFLEYALRLAQRNKKKDCYSVLDTAESYAIWHFSQESQYLIRLCWLSCAMCLEDGQNVCAMARWFLREYQYAPDSSRLYAVLHRMFRGPNSWYNSAPSQKFLLGRIKAMDKAITESEGFEWQSPEVDTKDLNVALLLLYGQMLYIHNSEAQALNYFYRAYALIPTHPTVLLHLALGYIHAALKRQAENRHYLIAQGMAFLFAYHESQLASGNRERGIEAKYNVARSLHMLGLTHLALSYYEQILSTALETRSTSIDFVHHAAFNVQSIYASSGNVTKAKEVTERWLVI